jgi:hypothetical protein
LEKTKKTLIKDFKQNLIDRENAQSTRKVLKVTSKSKSKVKFNFLKKWKER